MNCSVVSLSRTVVLCLFLFSAGAVSRAVDLTVLNNLGSGPGSFVQTVADANIGDTIIFDSDLSGATIQIFSAVTIAEHLTIDASSLTAPVRFFGQGTDRLFIVENMAGVTFRRVVFYGGRADDGMSGLTPTEGQSGGAIYLHEAGTSLTLIGCTLEDNIAGDGGDQNFAMETEPGRNGGDGGAISAQPGTTLAVIGCTFTQNNAGDGGFGIAPDSDSGDGGRGGAIFADGATVTIINSTFSGNFAGKGGITGITIGSGGEGGGICIDSGNLIICNSTLYVNFSGNNGDDTTAAAGGGIYANASDLELANSIVGGNRNGIVEAAPSDDIRKVGGTITSHGANFIGSNESIETEFPVVNGNGDLVGTSSARLDPRLFSLQDNGGNILTHEPLPNSDLIGTGNPALLPMDTFDLDGDMDVMEPLPIDQTGGSRIEEGTLDIGAVEYRELGIGRNDVLKASPSHVLKASLSQKIKKLKKKAKKLKRKRKSAAARRSLKKVQKLKKRLRAL